MPILIFLAMGYILYDIMSQPASKKGGKNELETLPRNGSHGHGDNGGRESRDGTPEHHQSVTTPPASTPATKTEEKADSKSAPVSSEKVTA